MKKFIVCIVLVAIFLCNCGNRNDSYLKVPEPMKKVTEVKVEKTEMVEVEVVKPVIYNIPLEKEIQIFTWKLCEQYNLSYEMVLAIIKVESNFQYDAKSHTSDRGLMQINSINYDWLSKLAGIENFNPYNAKHNILCGVILLDYLRDYWKTKGYCEEDVYYLTLLSYRRGIEGCKRYVQKYGLQSKYIRKITNYKIWLEQQKEVNNEIKYNN